MPTLVTMNELIERLDSFAGRGFPSDEVQQYLASTRVEPETLEPYVRFRSDHYTRNLVHKTATYELLVIGWGSGQKAPIHGHEGERCWARVERGRLRFTSYREVSTDPLVLEIVGTPADGEPGHLDGPADIHAVENLDSFGSPAVSLHVYSFPYDECDIYDVDRGEKRRVKLAYDSMYGRSPESEG